MLVRRWCDAGALLRGLDAPPARRIVGMGRAGGAAGRLGVDAGVWFGPAAVRARGRHIRAVLRCVGVFAAGASAVQAAAFFRVAVAVTRRIVSAFA